MDQCYNPMSLFQPDHYGPVPIYEQIKTWIKGQIISGAWPEHYKLLAEADLAVELRVSRGTVRKAIADLTKEGFLVRTHGRGTFVAPGALEQPLADRLVTFSEDLISRGIPFETEVLDQGVIQANERIANILSISTGQALFFLKRQRMVKDVPLILLKNYVIKDVCPDIEGQDFTETRLFDVLENEYGLQIDYGRRTFQALAADAETANHLALDPGDPVMHIEQQTFLSNNQMIEFSDLWLRGDQFKLSADVQRSNQNQTGLALSLLKNKNY